MSYEQGFIEKCAQYGVNPKELVKLAAPGSYIRKLIGMGDDALADLASKGSHIGASRMKTMGAIARNSGATLDELIESIIRNRELSSAAAPMPAMRRSMPYDFIGNQPDQVADLAKRISTNTMTQGSMEQTLADALKGLRMQG